MKELEIIINKILKDWLQSKGEGDIVFTDDIAINAVTDEIVSECHKEYDELLRQRDELREALEGCRSRLTCSEKPNNSEHQMWRDMQEKERDSFCSPARSSPI